jgi:hypothetical protein
MVDLRGLAEAGGDVDAAVGREVRKPGGAHIIVLLEALAHLGGHVGNILHHQIAFGDAFRLCESRRSRNGHDGKADGGQSHGCLP